MRWRFYTPVLRKRRKLTVYEQADEYRRLLLEGDARAARRIKAAYSDIARQLDRDLKALARRIEKARKAGLDEKVSWQLEQARIIELLGRVRKQIDGFAEIASGVTGDRQGELAGLGQTHAAALAKSAGITSGFRQLNQGQLTDLIGHLEDGSPLADLFREIAPRAISHARSVFARAAATGANPRATARVLAREVQGLTETRALLIARTETLRSYRTSTQRAFKANSDVVTGWRWMAAKNSRTCPMCLAMDGSVHSVDEVLVSHPACRCAMVPITEYSSPPPETGEVWFSKQPDDVKKEILGPSKFALYQRGELKLPDLVANTIHPRWGKGRQEATLAEAIANAGKRMASKPPVLVPLAEPLPVKPPRPAKAKSEPKSKPNVDPAHRGAAKGSIKSVARILPIGSKERIREAMKEIDKLHGVGGLPKIPVGAHSVRGELGQFRYFPDRPLDIRMLWGGQWEGMTFAHEFGHFIDHSITGVFSADGFTSLGPGDGALEQAVAAFNTAVARSPEIQAFAKAKKLQGLFAFEGKVTTLSDGMIDYYLRPTEIWARAYAQFVAVRSKNPRLLKELVEVRGDHIVHRASQWDEATFGPIEEAIAGILRAVGVMP